VNADGEFESDDLPGDDGVVAIICGAIALTMSGLVFLMLIWH
jgi:hypothetical protein